MVNPPSSSLSATAEQAVARKLPRNVESEAALLGAILIANDIAHNLPVNLKPEHFFEPLHGRIFQQMMALIERNSIVTPVTLKSFFEADEAMKAVGGVGYLAQLTGSDAGLIGARDFARQIYDLALLRELVAVGLGLVDSALDTSLSIDPATLVEQAEARLQRVSGTADDQKHAISAQDCVAEVIAEWDAPIAGVTCGCIPELDRAIGKIRPSELLIGAGRPGAGKTALAISYANGVARRGLDPDDPDGGAVILFSHEMSALEVGGRLIADTAHYGRPIAYSRIEGGFLDAEEREIVKRIHEAHGRLPLTVVPISTLTVSGFRRHVRRWKRRFEKRGVPLRLAIVDYLQLMSAAKTGKDVNRVNEISEISRGLKQVAMEEQIGVFALSQLSRAVEQRDDKRPRLSDLRESGSIEQDANKVILLYSELTYHDQMKPQPGSKGYDIDLANWEADREMLKDKLEIIVAKRRNGASGFSLPVRFYREFQAVRGAGQ